MRRGETLAGDDGYGDDHRRTLSAVLGLLLVVGLVGLVVFVVASVPATPPYTEFYVVNDSGVAADYSTNVTTGEQVRVTVGIRNNEHRRVTYEFVVRADGTQLDRRSVTLADTRRWERPITLSFDDPGQHRVRFLLYRTDRPDDRPYRQLRLVFRVSEG